MNTPPQTIVLNRFLRIVAVALVAAAATYALRTLMIEPTVLHEQCVRDPGSTFCVLRQTVIMGFVLNLYSLSSLVLGVVAVASRSRFCAWSAIVLGVAGALLYRIEFAALGLLLGALAATRAPIAPQHRQRDPQT